jgi:hypothetical protein
MAWEEEEDEEEEEKEEETEEEKEERDEDEEEQHQFKEPLIEDHKTTAPFGLQAPLCPWTGPHYRVLYTLARARVRAYVRVCVCVCGGGGVRAHMCVHERSQRRQGGRSETWSVRLKEQQRQRISHFSTHIIK